MASVAAPRPTSSAPGLDRLAGAATTHPYTCNSCQVAFRNRDLQRTHMHTDWHRYNLKRRVASLPPISAEIFTEKVLTAQASSSATAAKAVFEKACAACQKIYYSQNAYDNHLRSQRHRQKLSVIANEGAQKENGESGSMISSTISLGEPIGGITAPSVVPRSTSDHVVDSVAEAEFSEVINGIKNTNLADGPVSQRPTRPHHSSGETRTEHPLSPEKSRRASDQATQDATNTSGDEKVTQCLFCAMNSTDSDRNLDHMTKVHGLFIPERTYLTDLHGLLVWLWQRIYEAPYECIYCHRAKHTAEGVQGHMRDLGHCKIAFEDETDMIEVGQFYDFTSTYSDQDDDQSNMEQDADGWEDTSDNDGDTASEEIEVDGSAVGTGPSQKTKSAGLQAFVVDDDLYLPSGRIAGHRSLARYYRQDLHNYPSEVERQRLLEEPQDEASENVQVNGQRRRRASAGGPDTSRELTIRGRGHLGMLGVTDAKQREVVAAERRETERAHRTGQKYTARLQRQANNQKHFRPTWDQ